MTTVLIIGSGGREHALAHAMAGASAVDRVVCAPGNPGMEALGDCIPLDVADPAAVAALADDLDADLVVVGPEVPLVAGCVDVLQARGRAVFGPVAAGARLEGSKAWMKEVLAAAGVPTARHATFGADGLDAARQFLSSLAAPWVVKTDGLAAGKGVLVTDDLAAAHDAVAEYLSGAAFGDAGRTVVIEEGMHGPEVSLLVLCDGHGGLAPLAPAQDHKRVGDGDQGPNTGGMGAYSPLPWMDPGVVDEVMASAVEPTVAELARRGIAYQGVLYAGLMLTEAGPRIVEYNIRFGDPECQVVVPRLASDLFAHCMEAATGRLVTPVRFRDDACVTVVLAAEGYPTSVRTGDVIEGLDAAGAVEGVTVFHAGTRREGNDIVTAGGRVLAVTALAPDLNAARDRAYRAAGHISWPGIHYRRDIGAYALGAGAGASATPQEQL